MKRRPSSYISFTEEQKPFSSPVSEDGTPVYNRPSKSQRKRDAEILQKLGVSLMELTKTDIEHCPISEATRDAILMCKTIRSHPALKRQKQLIGKRMRNEDAAAIISFLNASSTPYKPASPKPSSENLLTDTLTPVSPVKTPSHNAIVIDTVIPPEANLRITGQGPELLIMHGWTGASEDFDPIVELLTPHFTCIRWDARPHYDEQVRIEQLAADVETIIRTRCLTRPILLGHSMGALVAFEYLKTYGEDLLSGLVIVDMTPCMITHPDWPLALYGHYTEENNQQFIDELDAAFVDRLCQLIVNGKKISSDKQKAFKRMDFTRMRKERLDKLAPRAWIDCWQSFVNKDYRPLLSNINLPTLLMYGEKSNFYGPAVGNYVHDAIPDSHLVVFKGAGHSPQVEQPDSFAKEMLLFVD